MRKQRCVRDQSLDKFDKFWIDLNEATSIRPEAKAQIYSVNENLPANQVARMWGVLDQLERTRRKKKDGEATDEKVNCKYSKVLFVGCVSIFTIARGFIFIPHANTVLADYGKALILSKETYSNKQKTPPFKTRPSRIKTCLKNAETSDRHQTVPDPHLPCTIIISNQVFLSSTDPLTRVKKMVSTYVNTEPYEMSRQSQYLLGKLCIHEFIWVGV